MESIQEAIKEHIQGKLREIGSTLEEERRELSVCFLPLGSALVDAMSECA